MLAVSVIIVCLYSAQLLAQAPREVEVWPGWLSVPPPSIRLVMQPEFSPRPLRLPMLMLLSLHWSISGTLSQDRGCFFIGLGRQML